MGYTLTLGERLMNIRKSKGMTQVELAKKIGTIQSLISDYERERLRPNPEMLARLAIALDVTTDEIIGLKPIKAETFEPSLKVVKRMRAVEDLPPSKQKKVLSVIDTFLENEKLKQRAG